MLSENLISLVNSKKLAIRTQGRIERDGDSPCRVSTAFLQIVNGGFAHRCSLREGTKRKIRILPQTVEHLSEGLCHQCPPT
ncbi:unnamed protein product [[Actinomadura] parvosata subsp. kistnae]|nr:unnamed protein product [Actinomadura parvosata subsp. kistnae]